MVGSSKECNGNGNGIVFISRIFYVYIFKCALQHFVGDFHRTASWRSSQSFFNVTSRIHRCPQNKMSDARPQHRELRALHFTNNVWVLQRPTVIF